MVDNFHVSNLMMHIHFIGIGGSAMGSVAIACKHAGYTVTGSDEALYPPMSTVLATAGIRSSSGYDPELLLTMKPDVIIVGNAISRGNPELECALDHRLPMTSMAQFIGEHFIARHTSVVIAGTHGKTTTSSITAHILEHTGHAPGFLIGGVPGTFDVGCRMVPASQRGALEGIFVTEGDEYDTAFFDKRSKFVHYRPTVAVLNNIEFDHADIFSSLDDIIRSFSHLVRIVPGNGRILANADDPNVARAIAKAPAPCETVGFSDDAYWHIGNVRYESGSSIWEITGKVDEGRALLAFPMPGEHNVRNASMAALACRLAAPGLSWEAIAEALASYVPPKRRLEHIATWKGCTVIDDFAHHPTAIAATMKAIAQRYAGSRIHVCFEPRSNTTTRSFFQQELAECFDGATSVCIGPVNRPERYLPEERLDTVKLVADITLRGIAVHSLPSTSATLPWGDDVRDWFEKVAEPGDVILLLSNGNLGGLRALLSA